MLSVAVVPPSVTAFPAASSLRRPGLPRAKGQIGARSWHRGFTSAGREATLVVSAATAVLLAARCRSRVSQSRRADAKRRVTCLGQAEGTEERKLNDRQIQFWEILEEDFEDDVVPMFKKETLGRVYEFIQYCKYDLPIPELAPLQEIDPEFFPGLRAAPWWAEEECGEWLRKVKEGLPYVQGELADLLEDNEASLISDSVQNDVMGGGWSGFRLQRLGDWIPKNCELFPDTVQLLKESGAPLAMRGVIVARQAPHTGVAPHSDGRNFFLTAHFGLSVPEECDITVGGVTRPWKEDDCVILDTSFQHSTRNDSDEDRFVLIVDFWHPDLSVPEREALEYIYDFRKKFEQGKIKFLPKMPSNFWETLQLYSGPGGGYTEEKVPNTRGGDLPQNSLGGFNF